MLLNKNIFKDILDICKNEDMPLDCMLTQIQKNNNCYMFYPGIITPKPGLSDITHSRADYTKMYNLILCF